MYVELTAEKNHWAGLDTNRKIFSIHICERRKIYVRNENVERKFSHNRKSQTHTRLS